MSKFDQIIEHYSVEGILDLIKFYLSEKGVITENVSIDDLGSIDELHVGKGPATRAFFSHLRIPANSKVLDIGCGLGGPARIGTSELGWRVVGMDLTPKLIKIAKSLNQWTSLDDSVELMLGNAEKMPFANESFDGAYMIHVGMNIERKDLVFSEAFRVLKPGARFGIYDVCGSDSHIPQYPLPWSDSKEYSWLETADLYVKTLESVGFKVFDLIDRSKEAVEFFDSVREARKQQGTGYVEMDVIMRESGREKSGNLARGVRTGTLRPTEIFAIKH